LREGNEVTKHARAFEKRGTSLLKKGLRRREMIGTTEGGCQTQNSSKLFKVGWGWGGEKGPKMRRWYERG